MNTLHAGKVAVKQLLILVISGYWIPDFYAATTSRFMYLLVFFCKGGAGAIDYAAQRHSQ
jgi:hypothetical protein